MSSDYQYSPPEYVVPVATWSTAGLTGRPTRSVGCSAMAERLRRPRPIQASTSAPAFSSCLAPEWWWGSRCQPRGGRGRREPRGLIGEMPDHPEHPGPRLRRGSLRRHAGILRDQPPDLRAGLAGRDGARRGTLPVVPGAPAGDHDRLGDAAAAPRSRTGAPGTGCSPELGRGSRRTRERGAAPRRGTGQRAQATLDEVRREWIGVDLHDWLACNVPYCRLEELRRLVAEPDRAVLVTTKEGEFARRILDHLG